MINILRRLLGGRPTQLQARIAAAQQVGMEVDPMLRACLPAADSRDLTIPARRRRLALFAWGAILAAPEARRLDETQRLAALVWCMNRLPGFSPQDVSGLVNHCMNTADEPESLEAIAVGQSAIRAWQAGDRQSAMDALPRLLAGDA
jgi:hypothetical protein